MRFIVLVFTDPTGSQTAVTSSHRFITRAAAEQAAEFFRQFTSHVMVVEDT